MKVLHGASECFPLVKTGGLADVLGALPGALQALGVDARVCLPAYRGLPAQLPGAQALATLAISGVQMTLLEGRLTAQGPPIWLLDAPALYDRPGDPYHDLGQTPWLDNGWRFGCFGAAVAALARGAAGWQPDVVHLHDWQAALAAPLLTTAPQPARSARPVVVYTIHNLAYQGQFSRQVFDMLGLQEALWHPEAIEYWSGFSFMKAGINFADAITTVSPTYAQEIQTPAYGEGLDGVLRARRAVLHGIVNGVDTARWDPTTDRALPVRYGPTDVRAGKAANAAALRAALGLAGTHRLLAYIGRFAHQKGADLLLAAAPELLKLPLDLVVLGAGDPGLERAFAGFAAQVPDRAALHIGYDEALAHRITAAADLQLMPSRFEPCGLNQMYAQRYGTLPVVRATGGLADTVTDATARTLAAGRASGVHFRDADMGGVLWGVRRALELLAEPAHEAQLRQAGMARDFSWAASARQYAALYHALLNAPAGTREARI